MKAVECCLLFFVLAGSSASAGMISFQEEVAGYLGTHDANIWTREPGVPSSEDSLISVSNGIGLFPYVSHGMLRFDQIFGPGKIPLGATIHSAELFLYTNTTIIHGSVHRILFDWSEGTVTWNSVGGNGIQPDEIESSTIPSATLGTLPSGPGELTLDVTADVQAWADGASNFGWVFLPAEDSTNYWGFLSSEDTNSFNPSPILTITFDSESFSPVPEPSSFIIALCCGLCVVLRTAQSSLRANDSQSSTGWLGTDCQMRGLESLTT